MNDEVDTGTLGWESIIPSARKSIHSHPGCLFNNMGGYKLDNTCNPKHNIRQSIQEIDDEGIDEIDNIMSKFARQQPVRQQKLLKKNSFQPQQSSDDSELDDSVYSKSLPAYLPSNSYCSVEFGNLSFNEDYINNISKGSAHSNISLTGSTSLSNNSWRNERLNNSPESIRSSPKCHQPTRSKVKTSSKGLSSLVFYVLVPVLSVLIVFYSNLLTSGNNHSENLYNEVNYFKDLSNIGAKYTVHEDSILQVQSGISTIFERQDAGSFIFVYDSELQNFNKNHFDNFIDDVATKTARYLRNESKAERYIVIQPNYLSHSDLINQYKDKVSRTGVMVVKELDELPTNLAMAFHYYCDEFTPLVKRSAIFFTLDRAQCVNVPRTKSTHVYVENCLLKKWNGVPPDNIRPLLNRIVNVIIDVTGSF